MAMKKTFSAAEKVARKAHQAGQVAEIRKVVSDFSTRAAIDIETGNFSRKWLNPNGEYRFAHMHAANFATGQNYSMRNSLILNYQDRGSRPAAWVGFTQIKKFKGAHVRKGAKSLRILKPLTVKIHEKGENGEDVESVKCIGFGLEHVFNILDVENLPEKFNVLKEKKAPEVVFPTLSLSEKSAIEFLDKWFEAIPAKKVFSEEHLNYFSVKNDEVHFEPADTFISELSRIHVFFHEIGHWTGGKARLDRKFDGKNNMGSKTYAHEELVAELTANIICESVGLHNEIVYKDSLNYLNCYRNVLGKDAPSAFIDVIGDVFNAVAYLYKFRPAVPAVPAVPAKNKVDFVQTAFDFGEI